MRQTDLLLMMEESTGAVVLFDPVRVAELRNYLKTLNVIARSAATRQSESLAGEIASLRSQGQVRRRF
jgi:hypothetical protein